MGRAIDRISDLPDTIRLQILSLLPRKFAIRTSALSRRWRDVWRYRWPYATTLSFCKESARGLTAEEFASSVDQYLKLRGDRKVEILHLFFHPGPQHQSTAERWIEYAIANGVEELYLDFANRFSKGGAFQLPDCLRNGESLAVLSLQYCDFRLPLDFRKLNFLEMLCLKCVNVSDAMIVSVITGCPFLERLDLRQCLELRSINISGENLRLRSLIVVDCWRAFEIKIVAPNLRSFHFSGAFLKKYTFGEVSSLVDAVMSSSGRETGIVRSNWFEIIQELANVKILTLCSRAVQQMAIWKESAPPVLGNLQELQLLMDLMTETNLSDIAGFFRTCHCPKLAKVFIGLPTHNKDPTVKIFLKVAQEENPECDFGCLKIVKMNNFKGYKNEVELVRFFLRNATVLESMVLVTPQEMDYMTWLKFRASVQLEFSYKASANAKLVICHASEDDNGICPTHYDAYDNAELVERF